MFDLNIVLAKSSLIRSQAESKEGGLTEGIRHPLYRGFGAAVSLE
jgi:hypothetical protein